MDSDEETQSSNNSDASEDNPPAPSEFVETASFQPLQFYSENSDGPCSNGFIRIKSEEYDPLYVSPNAKEISHSAFSNKFPHENDSLIKVTDGDTTDGFSVQNCGPRNCPESKEPVDYFNLFMSEEIFRLMTQATNAVASSHQKSESYNASVGEMKDFIAVMLNMGLTDRKDLKDYWSVDPPDYIPWFVNTMTLSRFEALHHSFLLTAERRESGLDPWIKVRPLLDVCNELFKKHYVPFQNLSTVESLIRAKNKNTFITTNFEKLLRKLILWTRKLNMLFM